MYRCTVYFSSKEFEKGVQNLTEILKSENFQALYSNVAMVNVWNEKQRAGEHTLPGWDRAVYYRSL